MFRVRWLMLTGALAVVIAIGGLAPTHTLQVSDPVTGRVLWSAPVQIGDTFTLAYVNIAYDTPTEERYRVQKGGALVLYQVAYGSQALAGDCSIACDLLVKEGAWWTQQLSRELPSLDVRLDRGGEHAVVFKGERVVLSRLDADAVVQLRVMRYGFFTHLQFPQSPCFTYTMP
jgi:hypothetical protein